MGMRIDPLSLRMKVFMNVPLEFTVESGKPLAPTDSQEALAPVIEELAIIRNMEIPGDVLEYQRMYQAGTEIRQIRVHVSSSSSPRDKRHYIVSYQTIRGKEVGCCKTYTSGEIRSQNTG